MSSDVVWIDGALCPAESARVSPFDHGLLTGDGVFETLVVYGGEPFAVRRHLERLAFSCKGLGLACPDAGLLRDALSSVISANGLDHGRLRITVTGGVAPLGSDRGGAADQMVVVAGAPLGEWPETADVVVVPWPRNERGALAGLKTTSYGENVVALAYAKERGAGEAIFANTVGSLCEGTGSNVFLSMGDGRLITPTLASGCLAGVTRALVLEVTGAVEEDVPVSALSSASEAFLTSTTRAVQPIGTVDGVRLGAAPGPLSLAASAGFDALVARTLDP
ncbi:MAG: branched-chain amino acid aminotransferase [Actinomycetota bacterium]|nr:branched-chain amino acid aminotransferase [Actinomycetota bacterium]